MLGLNTALLLHPSRAMALEISYSGRLTEESGKSIDGPQDFTVRFYNVPSQGDAVGPTLKLTNTELRDGVFQLSLNFDNNQLTSIFGDGTKAAYVEVEAGGKVYPRMQIIAVPLALRVPVDTNYLNYTDGKLKIESVDLNQVNGLSAALAAKADASGVSSNSVAAKNLSDLTNAPEARTNLGLGSLATVSTISNAEISSSAAIADTKLATISTAGKVSGSAITSGTIGGTTSVNSTGDITTTGTVNAGTVTTALQNGIQVKPFNTAAGNTGELRFNELSAGGSNYVGFKAPDTLAANKIWTLPGADGTNGQILTTDGSGNLDWMAKPAAWRMGTCPQQISWCLTINKGPSPQPPPSMPGP